MFDKQFQKLWLARSVEIEAIPTSGAVYILVDNLLGTSKDHVEKIDFQELIFAVVNWPNSELYGAFVCIICLASLLQTSWPKFSCFWGVGFCRF